MSSVPLHLCFGCWSEFSPVVVRSEAATRLVEVTRRDATNDPLEDGLFHRVSSSAAGNGGNRNGDEVGECGDDGAPAPADRGQPGVDGATFGQGSVDVERCNDGGTSREGAEALGEVFGHGPPEGSAAHHPTVENDEQCGFPIFHKVD